jgi:hypothetical protein
MCAFQGSYSAHLQLQNTLLTVLAFAQIEQQSSTLSQRVRKYIFRNIEGSLDESIEEFPSRNHCTLHLHTVSLP